MILIVPFGLIEVEVVAAVKQKLETFRTEVKVTKALALPKLQPRRSPFSDSEQLNAEAFLPLLGKVKDEADYALGITNQDLFVSGLNFIFGLASDKVCIISLYRLKSNNKALLLSRAKKEAIHELGHCFGLKHCPDPRCVMHFSNSITDTDYKSEDFCKKCKAQIRCFSR